MPAVVDPNNGLMLYELSNPWGYNIPMWPAYDDVKLERISRHGKHGVMTQVWKSTMHVSTHVKAPLYLSQAAAPHLRKTNGCIVNITDIHAERPLKNYLVYTIAKAGLTGLTRSLARELGPEARVNGVAPGTIVWPEGDEWGDELSRQRIINQSALKRIGEPDDIAKAVDYLVSAAPYVTGQVIAVDGGRSIAL